MSIKEGESPMNMTKPGSPANSRQTKIATAGKSRSKHGSPSPLKRRLSIATGGGKNDNAPVILASPTSISMKNSLIIAGSDQNFDFLYKQMVKRKIALALTNSLMGKS